MVYGPMDGPVIISKNDAIAAGLKHYFTGKPCKRGHIAKRAVIDRGCVVCSRIAGRKHYVANREKRGSVRTLKWREENPEKYAEYCASDKHRESNRRAVRRWTKKNRDVINSYRRAFTESNISFRLRINLANRINQAVRYQWGHKSARTLNLIGCSVEELRSHLERLWSPGMSWENYGYGDSKWHIDHVRPCASFDLTEESQQRLCFNFSNLQPLWQDENFRKGDR